MGETRSSVGEGEKSKRAAHAGGQLHLKPQQSAEKVVPNKCSLFCSVFAWKGAGGAAATAGAGDAEELRGSGGVLEETRRADPGAGAGEGEQTPGGES